MSQLSIGTGNIYDDASASPKVEGSTIELAGKLFKQYTLPFEIVSLLLLVAMVGAILLSKKEIK